MAEVAVRFSEIPCVKIDGARTTRLRAYLRTTGPVLSDPTEPATYLECLDDQVEVGPWLSRAELISVLAGLELACGRAYDPEAPHALDGAEAAIDLLTERLGPR